MNVSQKDNSNANAEAATYVENHAVDQFEQRVLFRQVGGDLLRQNRHLRVVQLRPQQQVHQPS
jgi:hypothetical protein